MSSPVESDDQVSTAFIWRRAALVSLIAFVAVNAVVVGIRVWWLVTDGQLQVTTGSEGAPIYSVWKVLHGHPLYERPNADNYALSLYNFGFYYAYAGLLALLGVSDAHLITAARLVTAAFAVLGAIATWRVAIKLAGPAGAGIGRRSLAFALCLTAWLGPGTAGWFPFSVRSDIMAAALAVCGLAAYLRARERRSVAWAAASALTFYAAWASKQNVVLILAGLCLFEVIQGRRWKLMFGVAGSCAIGMAAGIVIGGPNYFTNIVTAPSINPIVPFDAGKRLLEVVLPSILFYGFAIASMIPWQIRRTEDAAVASHRAVEYAFVISTLIGLVFMGKVGSSRNHFYESMMVAAAAGTAEILRALATGRRSQLLIIVGAAVGCALPLAMLAVPHLSAGFLHWNLTFGNHETYVARARLAEAIRRLPPPVYVDNDDILSQPWIATGGQYPSFLIDPIYYYAAYDRGLLEGGGIAGLVKDRKFAAVIAQTGYQMLGVADAVGYRLAALPPEAADAPNMMGQPATWELYVLPKH